MSRTVPDSPLPSWVQNGCTVTPDQSYASRNVYTAIGMVPQKFGYPRYTVS